MPPNQFAVRGNLAARNTSRSRSPQVWAGCQWESIVNGEVDGVAVHIDFEGFKTSSNINAAEAYWDRGFKAFGSTGGFITAVDQLGGAVKLGSDGDNEGSSIALMEQPFQINRSYGNLWYEARVKFSSISDTLNGVFLGLMDSTALSATVPIAAAGTLADVNLVGFHRLEGDGDQVDCVYKADGITQVTVQTDALGVSPLSTALVADTYVKLGMRYDPWADQFGRYYLSFYIDNLYVAKVQVASASGTDFPNDVRLAPVLAVLNATGTTPGDDTIDWLRVAQTY